MAKVLAVCKSEKKGTSKSLVEYVMLKANFGIVGDAHAGPDNPIREISLLAIESIQKMNCQGFDFKAGDFAENLTTTGLDLVNIPVGTQIQIGEEVILEVTQIGKKCHGGCAILRQVGKCIMPKEGIFARVIIGGLVRPEDAITII